MTRLSKFWTGAVAYVSLGVGAGLSVAGNLADTYRTRGDATDTLDRFLAAGWPVLVLLAIEMFVSPRWSAKRMFQVWRWVGCLAVGGMAMVVSWTHLHDLMASRGQLAIVAILGPLAIDGMAIMATGLILSTRTRGHLVDTGMANALWTPDMANPSHVREVDTDMASPLSVSLSTDRPPSDGHDWTPATEPGAPWPEDMSKLMSWTAGHERALDIVTKGVGDQIEREMKAMATPSPPPTPPVVVGPPSGGIPVEARELLWAWDPATLKAGAIDAQVATTCGVSTRTARRWRFVVLGQVSAPPAGGD